MKENNSKPRKTWNVFLDTEVFTAERFNVRTSKLAEIHKLASVGKINLVISEATVQECRKRIQKMVSAAVNGIKVKETWDALKILKQTKALENSAIWMLDKKNITAEINSNFDSFLKESKAIILDWCLV